MGIFLSLIVSALACLVVYFIITMCVAIEGLLMDCGALGERPEAIYDASEAARVQLVRARAA